MALEHRTEPALSGKAAAVWAAVTGTDGYAIVPAEAHAREGGAKQGGNTEALRSRP